MMPEGDQTHELPTHISSVQLPTSFRNHAWPHGANRQRFVVT